MKIIQSSYQPDSLGSGYEQKTLNFVDDYEGKVTATLIRKKAEIVTTQAVLYIHGFIDYFFQTEMAEHFNHHGYNFYALDLRKYGRSHLPHQKFYNVRNISEYDAEITQALNIIADEGHNAVLLSGHSTGGLITTLYATHHPEHPLIKALWVNSPFYDFNMPTWKKKYALPKLSALGKYLPNLKFPSELNKWYVPSIHQKFHGEWNFNLQWKQQSYSLVYVSFVRAIFEAQKEIHAGVKMTIPTLVMHSHQTTYPKKYNHDAETSDVILDVKDIQKYAKKLQGDVTVITIKNGLHDLVLSAPLARQEVYSNLFKWLAHKMNK